MFDPSIWRQYLVPGLDGSLGWAWWALLAVAVVAMVGVLAVGPTRAWRLLAFTALAALVGFLFTQQILGPPGHPIYFGVNVRYIAPALALGLVALPGLAVRWPVLRVPILALYLLLLASLQLNPTLWPIHVLSMAFVPAVGNADSLIGIGVGLVLLVGGIAAVLVRPHHEMLRRDQWVGPAPWPRSWCSAWSSSSRPTRTIAMPPTRICSCPGCGPETCTISASGSPARRSIVQYPLYGLDLSNHVQFVGRRHSDGSFDAITTCSAWRRIANAGHYDYLYAASAGPGGKSASEWMKGDPAVTRIDAQGPGDLYQVARPARSGQLPTHLGAWARPRRPGRRAARRGTGRRRRRR